MNYSKPDREKLTHSHPCFNRIAKKCYGRVHLPIAPNCNIQCNYCNRLFDCLNVSAAGLMRWDGWILTLYPVIYMLYCLRGGRNPERRRFPMMDCMVRNSGFEFRVLGSEFRVSISPARRVYND